MTLAISDHMVEGGLTRLLTLRPQAIIDWYCAFHLVVRYRSCKMARRTCGEPVNAPNIEDGTYLRTAVVPDLQAVAFRALVLLRLKA